MKLCRKPIFTFLRFNKPKISQIEFCADFRILLRSDFGKIPILEKKICKAFVALKEPL